jgi:hypothetical protein
MMTLLSNNEGLRWAVGGGRSTGRVAPVSGSYRNVSDVEALDPDRKNGRFRRRNFRRPLCQ